MSQSTIVVAEASTEAPAEGEAPASGEAGHTTEGTAAEGGHGGFPPMDAHSFPSQIFWLVIFFALLYLLMSKSKFIAKWMLLWPISRIESNLN